MLIQRWMHAGYESQNLIGDFILTVRPSEHQILKFQHLHSALDSLQPLISKVSTPVDLFKLYGLTKNLPIFSHLIKINISDGLQWKPHFIIYMS